MYGPKVSRSREAPFSQGVYMYEMRSPDESGPTKSAGRKGKMQVLQA